MNEHTKKTTNTSMASKATLASQEAPLAQSQIALSGGGSPIQTYLSPVSFWAPHFIDTSAWLDHAPFAFWMTSVLRPRTFVELGTQHGFSYFAFCQAVKALGMDTRCYAVDTWKGDEHSGFYGKEVFYRVRDYNESHYAAFSQLVRSTFDQTLTHFSDASIDLLHIDGRHFYDDVKQDFESWRPKLSDRAVVLFHDTNVRARNFGVFRFWDEISRSFPSFEFLHGHGLGVLGFGVNLPKEITTFFQFTGERSVAAEVRQAYAALGARLVAEQQNSAYVSRVEAHKAEAKESRREVKHLRTKLKNSGSIAAAMGRSTSWRTTKPMRLISRGARGVLRKARRALTLAWWLDGGQSGRELPKSGSAAKIARKLRPTTKVTLTINRWQDVLDYFAEAPASAYFQLRIEERKRPSTKAASQHPGNTALAMEHAEIATRRQDWPAAASRWQAVLDGFGDNAPPKAYIRLSGAHRNQGNLEGAEAALNQGRAQHPENAALAMEHAEIATRRPDWPAALARWQAVLDGVTDNLGTANLAKLHISVSRRRAALGMFKNEIADYVGARTTQLRTKKIVIYTAIAGGYDTIKLPEHPDPHFDYVLFTDTPAPDTGVYQVRPITYLDSDATRRARFAKTHPHMLLERYDIAIWVDSNIMVVGDIDPLIEKFLASGNAVGVIPHPQRTSVYEELEACIKLSKDEQSVMDAQIAHYRQLGFDCTDLIESNVMMFKLGDQRSRSFLDCWWAEIDHHSKRDQISLNFALKQSGVDYCRLMEHPANARNHSAFALVQHDAGKGPSSELIDALQVPFVDPYAGPSYADVRVERIAAQNNRRIDVIVCVHNALDDVRQCLESVRKARQGYNQKLILIDDGSDKPTAKFLKEFASTAPWVELHRSETATGYTKAANRGMAASTGELVIFLNSDTVVTDSWAEKMADAVFSTAGAGIVGPMSNAASHQSIPEHRSSRQQTAVNELPPELSADQMSRYCEQWSVDGVLPRVPLVHGFCFGVTRAVIDGIGFFDEANFPRGYGEENEYCFRAVDAGFGLVIATHTYVFHAKSKSYGDARLSLAKAGSEVLRQLHGRRRIERAIKSVESNPILVSLRRRASSLYQSKAVEPAAIQETSSGQGGAMVATPGEYGASLT